MSWQRWYLENGWAYKKVSSQSMPNGGITASMGSTVQILNEDLYGLCHTFAVALSGSLDCRNATISIQDIASGTTLAVGQFVIHQLNDTGLNGWWGTVFSSSLTSDNQKTYIAQFSPSEAMPLHKIIVTVTLPTPTLDPAINTCVVQWVGILSIPLNEKDAIGSHNQNGTFNYA